MAYSSQYEYLRQMLGSTKVVESEYRFTGALNAIGKIKKEGGIRSLYRGLGPLLVMTPILAYTTTEIRVLSTRYKRDGEEPHFGKFSAVFFLSPLVAEALCFPLRYAYVLMAGEQIGLPQPRPTARQILTDAFKHGFARRAVLLSFAPAFASSWTFTMVSSGFPISSFIPNMIAYMFNLVSIRLMIASLPGAPRPYASFRSALAAHLQGPRGSWLPGFPMWTGLMIGSFAYGIVCNLGIAISNGDFERLRKQMEAKSGKDS
jgi:hypothetical protein